MFTLYIIYMHLCGCLYMHVYICFLLFYSDLAVEFFQDISPHAIGKLDCESASTVVK